MLLELIALFQPGTSFKELLGHRASVKCLVVDELKLYTCSYDSTIKIWNKFVSCVLIADLISIKTGDLIYTISGHTKGVRNLIVDSNYIYSASDDKTVKIWDKCV